jgi:hypothetical protein
MILTQAGNSWTALDAPLPADYLDAVVHPKGQIVELTGSSSGVSLTGIGCGLGGMCAAAGTEGGTGLIETQQLSGLPEVLAISPDAGGAGTVVTITGSNFTPGTQVHFGSVPVPQVRFVDANELVATVPADVGLADVGVTIDGLSSRSEPGDVFNPSLPLVQVLSPAGALTGPVHYVVRVAGLGPVPMGTVSVRDGKGGLCSVSLEAGTGGCVIVERASGSPYRVTARYNGDANYGSWSGTTTEVLRKPRVSVALSATPRPASTGPITYHVSVADLKAELVPRGVVAVQDGRGRACIINLIAGSGLCSITERADVRRYEITASYEGDGDFRAAKGEMSERVARAKPRFRVTLTQTRRAATVLYRVALLGRTNRIAPTGTIIVRNETGRICVITLGVAGAGRCPVSEKPGTYRVSFSYRGDSNYEPVRTTLTEHVS